MEIKKNKSIFPLIVLFIFCFLLTFLICFSPFAQGFGHGHDSAIFATVGNALNNDRVLYTEIVDNKGPLLYFINALGLSINYDFGLFIIEFIFFCVGSFYAYKTAMLLTKNSRWISCLAAIFSMLLFLPTLQGGNFTEEYAILFINIATYFVAKFLFNDYKLKWYELSVIGMCFAATFLLRANLCAFFVAEIIVLLFLMIKNKDYRKIFHSAIFIMIGAIVFIAPFALYLMQNNALSACLDIVYFGVRDSFGYIPLRERIVKLGGLIMLSDEVKAFTVMAFAFILFLTKPKIEKPIRNMLIIAFLGIFITLYANSLTGGPAWAYTHYFMTFIPILVIVSSWLFMYIYSAFNNTLSNKLAKNIIILILIFIVFITPLKSLANEIFTRVNISTPEKSDFEKYIIESTLVEDTVQIISVNDTIYYPTKKLPTSKHIYFVGGFAEDRKRKDADEIAIDLYNAKVSAKLIIMPAGDFEDMEFIKSLSDKDKYIKYLKDYYTLDKEASKKFNCNIYIYNK